MSRVTNKKLKNFMQKMQDKGSEGFAAGPWEDTGGSGDRPPPVAGARTRSLWPSVNSIVATLALVLIVTGVVGAYLSNKSKREAVTAQIDTIVRAPIGSSDAGRLQDLEAKLANSLTPYEKRLRDLELNLTQTRSFYDERMQDLEQRLTHAGAPYEERLNKLEQMLVSASEPYQEKLRGIERQLLHTTNRLDELSSVMASLANSAEAIIEANVAMLTDPPAALPLQPGIVSREGKPLPRTAPVAATPAVKQPAARPESASEAIALKAPAAGPAPGSDTIALKASAPAPVLAPRPATAAVGPWVINIGSYAKESMAKRKQAAFRRQGIETERVTASVGGRTLYRLHVAGFASRKQASTHARTIEQQLGLKETWIKRR